MCTRPPGFDAHEQDPSFLREHSPWPPVAGHNPTLCPQPGGCCVLAWRRSGSDPGAPPRRMSPSGHRVWTCGRMGSPWADSLPRPRSRGGRDSQKQLSGVPPSSPTRPRPRPTSRPMSRLEEATGRTDVGTRQSDGERTRALPRGAAAPAKQPHDPHPCGGEASAPEATTEKPPHGQHSLPAGGSPKLSEKLPPVSALTQQPRLTACPLQGTPAWPASVTPAPS